MDEHLIVTSGLVKLHYMYTCCSSLGVNLIKVSLMIDGAAVSEGWISIVSPGLLSIMMLRQLLDIP